MQSPWTLEFATTVEPDLSSIVDASSGPHPHTVEAL